MASGGFPLPIDRSPAGPGGASRFLRLTLKNFLGAHDPLSTEAVLRDQNGGGCPRRGESGPTLGQAPRPPASERL